MPRAPSWPACCLLLQLVLLLLLMAATKTTSTLLLFPLLAKESGSVEQQQQQLHQQHQHQNNYHQQHQHNINNIFNSINNIASSLLSVAGDRVSDHDSRAATLCPPPCTSNSIHHHHPFSSSMSMMMSNERQQTDNNNNNNNNNTTQCLYYLQESHKEEVCGRDIEPERRRAQLHQLRMRHCCEHVVDAALPEDAFRGGSVCKRHLEALIHVDDIASRLSLGHAELLTRYDCAQNYSIAHDCKDCKEAYRRWVCSSLVPHYTRSGRRVLPCLSVCEDVEQQCPYLVPDQTVTPGEAAHPTPQYAGEPTFLCLDPNIPETGQQKLKSSHGDEACCYTHCGSPGRGGGFDEESASSTSSSSTGRMGSILGVCEHCPGRPHDAPSNAISRAPRTYSFNQVSTLLLLLWISFLITNPFLQTEQNVFRALIRCLLYSVRTFYRRFFKDRTHSSS